MNNILIFININVVSFLLNVCIQYFVKKLHKSSFQRLITSSNLLTESVSFVWDGILFHKFERMYDKLSNP